MLHSGSYLGRWARNCRHKIMMGYLFEFPCVRFTRVPNRYNSVSTTLCVSWYFNTNEQNQLELINTVWIWVRLFFLFLLFFLITQNRRTLLIHSNHLTKKHIFVIGLVKLIYSQNKTIDTCLVCFFLYAQCWGFQFPVWFCPSLWWRGDGANVSRCWHCRGSLWARLSRGGLTMGLAV